MWYNCCQFQYPKGREVQLILCWNGGFPFLIDGRSNRPFVCDLEPIYTKKVLLDWAAQNQTRCVGFEGDTRPPRRSVNIRTTTWSIVG